MDQSLAGRVPSTGESIIVNYADGRLSVHGSGYLAGATATLKDSVAYIAARTGLGLGDAVLMATTNPGRFVGGRGLFRAGTPADLIRFQWEQGFSMLAIEDVVAVGKRGI